MCITVHGVVTVHVHELARAFRVCRRYCVTVYILQEEWLSIDCMFCSYMVV